MGVRKTDGEIERMKEEIRELLFEKGFKRSDWYEVMWGVLVDDYVENEVGDWKTWGELIRQVKKNMETELSRRLGV
ncbi:MAG: hypothetical protein PHT97_10920 [Methanoculleus sp.]|uniref:hypothetical protein n=1 Tax=Methanoculleus sp. TaxID=90427 RepID=UPI0026194DBF|nr:hypothetical protein [Methanoculleus sp.]MDD2255252.1 hypothetical protein [Methanoculleus sp.]MDD4471653.1 hypothetical protein [Methanoculleus sp.]